MYEKVIRDNVHGDIYFNDPIFIEILDTFEMQRLRRILQLGGTALAYPGATHTRFSHSIGVYHILTLFFESNDLSQISEKDQKLVLLAGLMHDVGHGPFSHSFEKINAEKHEKYSGYIIKNPNGNILKILNKYQIDPNDVVSIIEGTHPNKILNLLVSSQLDADRLDYLKRDSYNCGVDYATLDIRWIVRHIKVVDHKMVFPKKLVYAIESYLLGRHHMYKQVYNHKCSIIFDALLEVWFKRLKDLYQSNFDFKNIYLENIFKELLNNQSIPIDKYLELDDYTMFEIFKVTKKSDDKILADLSLRLLDRKTFAIAKESEVDKKLLFKQLEKNGLDPNYYLIELTPKKSIIYRDGIINGKDETIWIQNKTQLEPLSKYSMFGESMKIINETNNEKILLFPKKLV
ncbi:HD superfamily phosphohydrolase [Williamsoniiplasma luminosum]|uniref:HD superfamily phosphohydrolase n=1 Tax=Williamsoniiplasma luminosum TaxID=214888 RepID=A0A2K8NT47_9MOLU|nr:HD domain-containing protein [Williamsoniiplasma luminosum]ATZ16959.1 HD superfamily phosphohydrolase [Williamsoniiplasma luminosum]